MNEADDMSSRWMEEDQAASVSDDFGIVRRRRVDAAKAVIYTQERGENTAPWPNDVIVEFAQAVLDFEACVEELQRERDYHEKISEGRRREGSKILQERNELERRVGELEAALREAIDRLDAIAQGKTAEMHEAVAARAADAARRALGGETK